MKRLLLVLSLAALMGGVLPTAATARARIVSSWNGHEIGSFYVEHPRKFGLVMADSDFQGYWLVRDAKWRHWGNGQTTATGKLASAALDGTQVRIRAQRHTYQSCLKSGDKVDFYNRAEIQIGGQHGWSPIPARSLSPQCNNPRSRLGR